jgi:hypothetical protein
MSDQREKTHRELFAEQIRRAQAPFVKGLSRPKWAVEQLRLQNEQVPTLIAAERKFVEATRMAPHLREAILRGLIASVEERGRVAAARAYFRERNEVYNREVIPAVAGGRWEDLDSFAVNWAYVAWSWSFVSVIDEERLAKVMNGSRLPPAAKPLVEGKRGGVRREVVEAMLAATELIAKTRHDLVVTNLQLIADRARAFHAVTPATNQADIMDHISTASEGSLAGIDKMMLEARPMAHWPETWHPVEGFCYWRGESASEDSEFVFPEFAQSGYRVKGHHTAEKHQPKVKRPECPASVFRTTTIGRIGGKLIQTYSQTHMHLGPGDKRLLYQANKVAAEYSESGAPDYSAMAERVMLDRVLWNFAKKAGVEVRDIARPVVEESKRAGLSGAIAALKTAVRVPVPKKFEGAPEAACAAAWSLWAEALAELPKIIAAAKKAAPTRDQVSEIMLWNSTVPVVSDEGNDRLVEGGAYAAPRSTEPDAAYEEEEQRQEIGLALAQQPLLNRKLLVLLGLAPLECVLPSANGAA